MPRQRKEVLVSQYLEGVSRAALEEYQDLFREFAVRRHGVYALYKGKRLHYVGLARDLRNRLKQHINDKHGGVWDRFSMYLTIGDDHIRELESLIVRIFRPKGNVQVGKFSKAENLQRKFAARVRVDAKRRLDELLGRVKVGATRVKRKLLGERKPVLASYVTGPMQLRAKYRGKFVRARVLRNGMISVEGKRFRSPSLAAVAACRGRRSAINGWDFWTYERAPGDWVRLLELRR